MFSLTNLLGLPLRMVFPRPSSLLLHRCMILCCKIDDSCLVISPFVLKILFVELAQYFGPAMLR